MAFEKAIIEKTMSYAQITLLMNHFFMVSAYDTIMTLTEGNYDY